MGGGSAPSGTGSGGGSGSSTLSGDSSNLSGSDAQTDISSSQYVSTCYTIGTRELTEGPYWVDAELNRTDIRYNGTTPILGVPLAIKLHIFNATASGCVPLPNVQVDLWSASYEGLYSDEEVEGTASYNYLRGYQFSDSNGIAHFLTTYPGWYSGRTPHIHVRVRTYNWNATTNTVGNVLRIDDTTQLFFNDTLSDEIYKLAPYNTRSGTRDTTNSNDSIYVNAMLTQTTCNATACSLEFGVSVPMLNDTLDASATQGPLNTTLTSTSSSSSTGSGSTTISLLNNAGYLDLAPMMIPLPLLVAAASWLLL